MRVANIIEEGKLGGPQIRMVRVAAAMDQVDTLIVMPEANSELFRKMCEEHEVAYRVLPLTRITKEWRAALAYIVCSPLEVLRLTRLLKREKIDLVHSSGGSWQYKAIIAAWFAGVPSIWHLNDTQIPSWVRQLFKLFSPMATGYIFASNRSRDYYSDALKDKLLSVVPSTVDAERFSPELDFAPDEYFCENKMQAPIIGTIANINPIKGLETFIHMIAHLHKKHPDLRFVIIGPVHSNQKNYHQKLLTLAKNVGVSAVLHWVGGRSDVRPLLSKFDIYVCSSLAESSPVSVWEAMAMGKAIVSTDVGDVALHVVDNRNGYVVPVGDHVALAEKVDVLYSAPQKCKRFGKASREEALSHFLPKAIAEKTYRFYDKIIRQYQA